MTFFIIVWKNIARRRTRSAMTAAGVAIAVAAVVASSPASARYRAIVSRTVKIRGADLVVQRAGGAVQLSSGIDERLGEKIGRCRACIK